MKRHCEDYQGGLVLSPAFVGWLWTSGRGWEAAFSSNSKGACKARLKRLAGLGTWAIVLEMGQGPPAYVPERASPLAQDRQWAESFLDLACELLQVTGLNDDDPRPPEVSVRNVASGLISKTGPPKSRWRCPTCPRRNGEYGTVTTARRDEVSRFQ
jgi:hypothetical protein